MPLRTIVLLVFFVGSLPICFFRPFYGIVLWIVIAFLNPQSYTWSFVDAFPWGMAVAIPTMAGLFLFDHHFEGLKSRLVFLLVLLWVWFTVTTLISVNTEAFVHHAADTWDRWKFVSKILLMTLCMIPIVSSFARLRYLVLTMAGCFGFYVAKALPFIIATGGEYRLYGPERSMIGDNNDFGLALNMTLPLFFFLAHAESRPWMKRLFAFLFVITIPAIFFTYSRGALVGLATVLTLMLLQSRRRLALLPVIALGVAIAIFFAPPAWQQRMNPSGPGALDASAQSRLNSWAYARNLASDYPITGGGFATFTAQLYAQYAPIAREEALGPHSVYFQLLGEHGYVGLGLYLVMVLVCFLQLRRIRRDARAKQDQQVTYYSQMLKFSMLGFLTSGFFLGRAYFDYFFAIVACVAILDQAAKERWAPQVATAAPRPQAAAGARV
jgi:putative inorganic carbon (HCO3(-)) transporter